MKTITKYIILTLIFVSFCTAMAVRVYAGEFYESGGLGIAETQWCLDHDLTTHNNIIEPMMGKMYDRHIEAVLTDGLISSIYLTYGKAPRISFNKAREYAEELIPNDSVLVEKYMPEDRSNTVVILYYSESLKSKFSDKKDEDGFGNWYGAEPGNFIILYKVYRGITHQVIIAIGNNP